MSKKGNKETFEIKTGLAEEIRKVVDSGRPFDDVEDFIKRAVTVYLKWEQDPPNVFPLFRDPEYQPFTPEQESFMEGAMQKNVMEKELGGVLGVPKESELERQNILREEKNLPILRGDLVRSNEWLEDNLDQVNSNIEGRELHYDGYPIIWRFYTRILPGKIALTELARMMMEEGGPVSLEKFKDKAYDIAEELIEDIEKYEKEKGLKRNEKISTGFPKFVNDKEQLFLTQRRFKDQYIGKKHTSKVTSKESFEGALIALGLIRCFESKNSFSITMTETGRNFCRLKNPVLDGDLSKAFSPEESEFILKKIIPQRELENIFVKSALLRIRESKERLNADSLDIIFLEECKKFAEKNTPFSEQFKKIVLDHSDPKRDPKKQTRIMAIRVATMGRLAEIGEVKWVIGEKGKSYFTAAVSRKI